VQVVNAASVERIDLSIKGMRDYPSLPQGTRISGGVFDTVKWGFVARPSAAADPKKMTVESNFTLAQASAITVVVIGDFVLVKGSDGDERLRAEIVSVPNALAAQESHNRVVVVNGVPDRAVEVTGIGANPMTIEAMQLARFANLPPVVTVIVNSGEQSLEVPLEFVAPTNSIVVAVFNRGDKIDFCVMSQ